MVGLMATISGSKVSSLISSVIFAADNPSKLEFLRQLKEELSQVEDAVLLSELLPSLLKLFSDRFSPVRKCAIEVVGEIGLKHLEFFPEIVPALLIVVDDDTPAVARQAITSGTDIFCCSLEKIAIQGLQRNELNGSLESAWTWMQKFKEKLCSIAFQANGMPGTDGRRLLALKFVTALILIYTPDPNSSTEPPSNLAVDGKEEGFSISWLRRGHPVLKVGDLSVEASQNLGLLLDLLRLPIVKSLSTSMVVVLINCLSAIAIKRPSFYGRILPVLMGLDPSNYVVKVLHVYGVQHALKNAFLSCLKCSHPSAVPWRDRLVAALREMKAGDLAEPPERALEGVCNFNGNVKEEKADSVVVKEEQSIEDLDSVQNKVGRKRSSDQESVDRNDDEDTPGKRARSMPSLSQELNSRPIAHHRTVEIKTESSMQAAKPEEDDMGPVQQLVAVFAALVTQGEKAAVSLDILIASISADLLADVVIANLRNLPFTRPLAEGDEGLPGVSLRQSEVDTDPSFRELSSFLMDAISASSSQQVSLAEDVQPSPSDDIEGPHAEESSAMDEVDEDVVCATSNEVTEIMHSDVPHALNAIIESELAKDFSVVPDFQVMGTVDAVIPGLDNAPIDGLTDAITSSSLASPDLEDASQDQLTGYGKRTKSESLPSMSTERSEELSSKTVTVDVNSGITSTATSLGPVQQFGLPKISVPVIALSDEEKDNLQKWLFMRIVEAYKQVAVAGGSQLRFSLLAYLGVEFPLDLDPWTLLQKHILSDYVNHEGHELTLRVLYRLYGESEERDLFSSAKATKAYDMFLLKVAETLRDSFPASDKSLTRLLGEVPHLPESILKLLECLCSPENGHKDEKELHSGDRVTQGLSAVWSLILLRPSLRSVLLKIALQSAVHHLEEVRMKAIRLVANKLYPLPSIALQIEEFAKDMLLSVVDRHISDLADTEKSNNQLQKNPDTVLVSDDQATGETISKDPSAHTTESYTPGTLSTTSISDAQRCMSLYFALCTKKHALLRQIFITYRSAPDYVKQAVHRHMPILIRTMGASPALLEIISDPPDGSENLVMQVLQTLTDGTVPSAELISTTKKLYETKIKDIEILFPVLSYLPKDEVLGMFSHIVNLPQDKLQAALSRLLQGAAPSGPVLTPPEVLIAIHGIDPDKDGIPLKKVTDACNACFEQKQIFTQQVIAKVLNQLVEQIPLPLLFMRTVLQAIGAFPALVDFIMDILSRLVNKQIWKYPKLWVGFLKCAQLTQPHSFNVLLQLPAAQLEGALNKIPAVKAALAAHANQSPAKSTLPRSILVVLGTVSDSQAGTQSQAGSQSQSAQPEVGEASSSDKDTVTEKSKESSAS